MHLRPKTPLKLSTRSSSPGRSDNERKSRTYSEAASSKKIEKKEDVKSKDKKDNRKKDAVEIRDNPRDKDIRKPEGRHTSQSVQSFHKEPRNSQRYQSRFHQPTNRPIYNGRNANYHRYPSRQQRDEYVPSYYGQHYQPENVAYYDNHHRFRNYGYGSSYRNEYEKSYGNARPYHVNDFVLPLQNRFSDLGNF